MRNNQTVIICLAVLVVCVLVAFAMDNNSKSSFENLSDSTAEAVNEIGEEVGEAGREIEDEVNDAIDNR